MHTEIKPGAYRQLFIDALAAYRLDAFPAELPAIDHYTALLRNPEYKFGKVTKQNKTVEVDLFFRS